MILEINWLKIWAIFHQALDKCGLLIQRRRRVHGALADTCQHLTNYVFETQSTSAVFNSAWLCWGGAFRKKIFSSIMRLWCWGALRPSMMKISKQYLCLLTFCRALLGTPGTWGDCISFSEALIWAVWRHCVKVVCYCWLLIPSLISAPWHQLSNLYL